MKTYFDFTLRPQSFLNTWLLFYVMVLLPYGWYMLALSRGTLDLEHAGRFVLVVWAVFLAGLFLNFYITRLLITHTRIGSRAFEFHGNLATYSGKVIPGFILSIFTMGIYTAWFIRDILRFFIEHSSLDGERARFHGDGVRLFIILFLSLFLPLLLVAFISLSLPLPVLESVWFNLAEQAVMLVLLVPYFFFFLQWFMNIQYRDKHIYLDTNFRESAPLILKEVGLTILTLGIYYPMMMLKLYTYFSDRSIVANESVFRRMGYELNAREDFIFLWGQLLLCILTLGIYVPWALSRVGKYIFSRTYLDEPLPFEP